MEELKPDAKRGIYLNAVREVQKFLAASPCARLIPLHGAFKHQMILLQSDVSLFTRQHFI